MVENTAPNSSPLYVSAFVSYSRDVFISYSRRDKDFVQGKLVAALRDQERGTWIDWSDIKFGEDWREAIRAGIAGADTFVFVISPDSVKSEVCTWEIDLADGYNKRLLPILHRDIPNEQPEQVHPALAKLNYIFCRPEDDFEQSLQSLLQAVDTDLEFARSHTRLLVRAIEWNTKERDDSFLLRGNDLSDAEQWFKDSVRHIEPKPTNVQIEYITTSRAVENAGLLEKQILQQAARTGRRLGLLATVLGLLVAGGVSFSAWTNVQNAEKRVNGANHQAQKAEERQRQAEAAEREAKEGQTQAEEGRRAAERGRDEAQTNERDARQGLATAQQQVTRLDRQANTLRTQVSQRTSQLGQAQRDLGVAQANTRDAETAREDAVAAREVAESGTILERVAAQALQEFKLARQELDALLIAMRNAQNLKELAGNPQSPQGYPVTGPILVLQNVLHNIREQNRLSQRDEPVAFTNSSGEHIVTLGLSPIESERLSTSVGVATVWDLAGRQKSRLLNIGGLYTEASFSPDSEYIALISNNTIRLWNWRNSSIRISNRILEPSHDLQVVSSSNNTIDLVGFQENISHAYSQHFGRVNSITSALNSHSTSAGTFHLLRQVNLV